MKRAEIYYNSTYLQLPRALISTCVVVVAVHRLHRRQSVVVIPLRASRGSTTIRGHMCEMNPSERARLSELGHHTARRETTNLATHDWAGCDGGRRVSRNGVDSGWAGYREVAQQQYNQPTVHRLEGLPTRGEQKAILARTQIVGRHL